ncbi:MAG: hypothetical protein MJE77_19750 [Proteobacteria bacterium]|nr:hypothetical protein [Pseudomonadota bacterium]
MNTKCCLPAVVATICGSLAASACKRPPPISQSALAVEFECNERRAAYILRGGFTGYEVGVAIDCDKSGPRVYTWQLAAENDTRATREHSLSPGEFDRIWQAIESTGWRNLGDCNNPHAEEGDPTYKIGIKDHSIANSMACSGKALPFPYNRLVDELDLVSAKYSR